MARTAIVTGGITGIGAATCKALKKAGYQVAATYFGNKDIHAWHSGRATIVARPKAVKIVRC